MPSNGSCEGAGIVSGPEDFAVPALRSIFRRSRAGSAALLHDRQTRRLPSRAMTDFSAFVAPPPSGEPHTEAIDAASACLDRFTAAFNASDMRGMDAELHFPHAMLSGAQRLDWAKPGQHPPDFFDELKAAGWSRTQYEKKEPVLVSNDKVHFVVTYTRHDATGTVLSTHVNLWIAVRADGRWGIALRSY